MNRCPRLLGNGWSAVISKKAEMSTEVNAVLILRKGTEKIRGSIKVQERNRTYASWFNKKTFA